VRTLVLLFASLVCTGLHAQTVYRCGPDGRVYSQMPCPQGRAVDVSDERSAEQRTAAEARVRDDQVRGNAMERERLAYEAEKPALAGKIGDSQASTAPVVATAKPSKKKKTKAKHASDDFKAVAPAKKTKT
jgi:hypothetical protein